MDGGIVLGAVESAGGLGAHDADGAIGAVAGRRPPPAGAEAGVAGPLTLTGVVVVSLTAPGGGALSPTRVAAMTMFGFTDW